MAYGGPEQI